MMFSLGMKAVLLIALAFSHYAETGFTAPGRSRESPDCTPHKDFLYFCSTELDPICATNGRTYPNTCIFCSAMLDRKSEPFGFYSYGRCPA
ncbi:PREDICTED: sperm-associated acrosin inhibitor-like [Miniopterus natalensis]|uniref:sperm-associated acrosin inhibitor-like n=1 Tax=Miniopterus natalensis TaxID=291302 RepID=UPI0007A6D7A4|nr:PREDICTED: sperm-associated acrosin inhibitor-like [Miniopterus natalensis]